MDAHALPMDELSDRTHRLVTELCQRGDSLCEDGDYSAGVLEYRDALSLLPEPREQWEASAWIFTATGDALFLAGDFEKAATELSSALRCPGALGNPFVHLRLGQCHLEIGNREKAVDELTRAYMGGGKDVFDQEEAKYFALVKSILREPKSGW